LKIDLGVRVKASLIAKSSAKLPSLCVLVILLTMQRILNIQVQLNKTDHCLPIADRAGFPGANSVSPFFGHCGLTLLLAQLFIASTLKNLTTIARCHGLLIQLLWQWESGA
jgi:hypothetical protein